MFQEATHEIAIGKTPDEALDDFKVKATLPELVFVAVALKIQHHAGGSMQQILDTARDSIKNEIELRRSLRVQTAQAKLSARVVTAMPFVLVALFSLITKDFLLPFFSSGLGVSLLVVALVMQASGILAIRRILRVVGA